MDIRGVQYQTHNASFPCWLLRKRVEGSNMKIRHDDGWFSDNNDNLIGAKVERLLRQGLPSASTMG